MFYFLSEINAICDSESQGRVVRQLNDLDVKEEINPSIQAVKMACRGFFSSKGGGGYDSPIFEDHKTDIPQKR